ncbi:hypothetical protein VNI00_013288 [Paramarasmius palmivorus]|uniref:Uncharacterized protein n=1 Tax=Paramarasmius palmivorus TaxID=297713 RepID=A0AAW0C1M5_9AGAR
MGKSESLKPLRLDQTSFVPHPGKKKTPSTKPPTANPSNSITIKIPARKSHPVVNIESSPPLASDVPDNSPVFTPETARQFAEFDRLMNEDVDYQLPGPFTFQTPSATKHVRTVSSPFAPGPNFHKRIRAIASKTSSACDASLDPRDNDEGTCPSIYARAVNSEDKCDVPAFPEQFQRPLLDTRINVTIYHEEIESYKEDIGSSK